MANSRQSATIFSPSSKRPTKRTRSSITEHSFQGITSSPRGGSVTHVSGTKCHLCVRPLINPAVSYEHSEQTCPSTRKCRVRESRLIVINEGERKPSLCRLSDQSRSNQAFGSRPNAWHVKRKSVMRKLLKGKFLSGTCPVSTSAAMKMKYHVWISGLRDR